MNKHSASNQTTHSHLTSLPLHRRLSTWIVMLAVVIIVGGIHGLNDMLHEGDRYQKPVRVVTAMAHRRDVPIYLAALGNVTPTYSVMLRTQVNGIMLRVLFREGQTVKTGDLLA